MKAKANPLKDTRLIQRLLPPYEAYLGDNPFAFGGGYKNGGLSKEATDLIRGIFRFDYMGAAEFEFGAVPEALNAIAQAHKDFRASSFSFPLAEVQRSWRDKSKSEPEGDATIYLLCRPEHAKEIKARIRKWAAGSSRGDLKESSHLDRVLRPDPDWKPDTCGWLELDNGFFFFTSEEMWRATAHLFNIEVAVA